MDNIPIIAVGGQVSTNIIGNDAFQETDMMGITTPITKHNFQILKSNDIAPTLMKSFKIALQGRPGPVYIDLPKDTQVNLVTKPVPEKIEIKSFKPTIKGNPIQIKKAAKMIVDAEKPLIIAGGGITYSDASEELMKIVDMTNIPVATTMQGKGVIEEMHPLALGMVGMHGRKIANFATIESDLIIAIGCRFSDRITGNLDTYAEKAKIIHIDIDPAEIGKNVAIDLPIVGDAKSVLTDLVIAIRQEMKTEKRDESKWSKLMKKLRIECDCNQDRNDSPIDPIKVMYEINKIIDDKTIITTGVGQHQMFAMHFLKMKRPRQFISSGGAGTMGFGFPAAIGAKVAMPDHTVIDIDGDGSFQMTMQELGTCKEHGIKVIPIILRNNYLGMVRQWLELFFDRRYSQVELSGAEPDFVKIAQAYGLDGIKVTKSEDIAAALKKALKSKETFIVEIDVKEESNILPMLAPGGNLKDAFGGCMKAPGKFF